MSRRKITVIIQDEGRDKGKTFILTEMPATLGERWATQALALLVKAGVPVGEEQRGDGMAGLAGVPSSGLGAAQALQDPSLDAWWDCVQYQHAPNQPPMAIDRGEACPIEEIATITELRTKVLGLHTGFFSTESGSTLASDSPATIPTGSRPTRISRPRSVR
jgi:hypothetical protein